MYKYNVMRMVADYHFVPGRVYIFNSTSGGTGGEACGIFDKRAGDMIILETMTFDMKDFLCRRRLPSRYRFVREATHEEVRDFAFNYGIMFHCLRI